ncbi:uncharacterized protein LOC141489551 [Macrotis lagotis]|uniref:uncharacterized protein LOC141489551 n=1 Tax=Macrotis lagotis TaxID=92651 RepID=UPI003D68BC97
MCPRRRAGREVRAWVLPLRLAGLPAPRPRGPGGRHPGATPGPKVSAMRPAPAWAQTGRGPGGRGDVSRGSASWNQPLGGRSVLEGGRGAAKAEPLCVAPRPCAPLSPGPGARPLGAGLRDGVRTRRPAPAASWSHGDFRGRRERPAGRRMSVRRGHRVTQQPRPLGRCDPTWGAFSPERGAPELREQPRQRLGREQKRATLLRARPAEAARWYSASSAARSVLEVRPPPVGPGPQCPRKMRKQRSSDLPQSEAGFEPRSSRAGIHCAIQLVAVGWI